MPFAYFGAKHGPARYYPPPSQRTIIEPFAGAAGYSVYWSWDHNVILLDSDPLVVDMWHQLQGANVRDILNDAEAELAGDKITSPFVYSIGCGLYRVKPGGAAKRSTMMLKSWPTVRRRIEQAIPRIAKWDVRVGDYTEAPDIWGTWFIDAPYQASRSSKAGNRYGHKAHRIDYTMLGLWAQRRLGQVIVCEQEPADWLPFEPFRRNRTRFREGDEQIRHELIWTQGPAARDPADQLARASGRKQARNPRTDYSRRSHKRGPYRRRSVTTELNADAAPPGSQPRGE